jgi:hypothetical protein
MKNHFKCIGIVGHPRHPTALTTHEMLWRWLCGKGYEVLVEQQIAHELQLSNVKTGTLAEIGQQADLAVVVGGDGNMLGAARTLAPATTLTSSALTAATSVSDRPRPGQRATAARRRAGRPLYRRKTLSAGSAGVPAGLPEAHQHRD